MLKSDDSGGGARYFRLLHGEAGRLRVGGVCLSQQTGRTAVQFGTILARFVSTVSINLYCFNYFPLANKLELLIL